MNLSELNALIDAAMATADALDAQMYGEMPAGLPPLHSGYRYAGELRDYCGDVFGRVFEAGTDDGWTSPGKWAGMKGSPNDSSADWHVSLPIEAREVGL